MMFLALSAFYGVSLLTITLVLLVCKASQGGLLEHEESTAIDPEISPALALVRVPHRPNPLPFSRGGLR